MSDVIWISAHPRHKPAKSADYEQKHRALWLSPLMEPRLGDHLARDLEAALLLEQDEQKERG